MSKSSGEIGEPAPDTEVAQTGEPYSDVPTVRPVDDGQTFSQHISELEGEVITLEFQCAESKSFMVFMETGGYADEIEVFLDDGGKILLSLVEAGTGVRYANAGGSFEFVRGGGTAYITEDGIRSYDECREGAPE